MRKTSIVVGLGTALSAVCLYATVLPVLLGIEGFWFTRYGWPFTISYQTDYANYSMIGLLLNVLIACAAVQLVMFLLEKYVRKYQYSNLSVGVSIGVGLLGMLAHYVAFLGLAPIG